MPPEDPPEKGEKTFTQEDLDREIGRRLTREREKFGDYDDLKAKATKLAELEAANASDLDKEKAARQQAERERDEAKGQSLRLEVAAEKGVKPKYISGSTREELEAAADEYLKDHPKPGDAGDGGGGGGGGNSPGVTSKPAEHLKGGGDPTTETATTGASPDPIELAKSVPRF